MQLTAFSRLLLTLSLTASLNCHADPIKLLPSDGQPEDQFGYSVAIDGKTVLVGAHNVDLPHSPDTGAAYVFSLTSDGWKQQAKLVAQPAFANDTVGGNVALHRDNALLGAIKRDDKGEDAGAVISFEHIDTQWQQRQVLTADDAKPGDAFGQSIALNDRFLVIGAPHSDAPGDDSGAVYVFARDNNQWTHHTKLTANDGAAGDLFGISVAIDGNTVLVGADLNDEKAEKAGAVYAFVFDDGQWQQQAKLMANDAGHTDIFGVRVALSGDTALISARRDDVIDVGKDAGSAYIFKRHNGTWQQTQKLIAPDGKADDRFGRGVALVDDTALITAMHHDVSGKNAGALYVFKKRHDQWLFDSKIVANDAATDDRFGWNLSVSTHHAVIATPHKDDNGNGSGAAYIVDLTK